MFNLEIDGYVRERENAPNVLEHFGPNSVAGQRSDRISAAVATCKLL